MIPFTTRKNSFSKLRYDTAASTTKFNHESNKASSYGKITSLIKKGLGKKEKMNEGVELERANVVLEEINKMMSSCDLDSLIFTSKILEKSCSLNDVLKYIRDVKEEFRTKEVLDCLTKIEKEIIKLISHEHRSMKAERNQNEHPVTKLNNSVSTKPEATNVRIAPSAFLKP